VTVSPSPVERLVRNDRAVGLSALVVLTALAWAYLLHMKADMSGMAMPGMSMPGMGAGLDFAYLFFMWTVMMVAMMLPSAAPTILLVASVYRRRREQSTPTASTAVFLAGYLAVWSAFSAGAALMQVMLHRHALLTADMASASPVLAGVLLIIAGIYQWLPAKTACLNHCRSPMHFIAGEWREGTAGAFVMGLRHGFFCLGCCWALMTLLFVAGVMNLLWVAALAGLVLVEKVVRGGAWIGRAAGLAMAAWGVWLVVTPR
jgi:predicted metal-binding membrane protein